MPSTLQIRQREQQIAPSDLASTGNTRGCLPDAVEAIERAPDPHSQHRSDAAGEFLAKLPEGRVTVTAADDARVLRRIDVVILPLMLAVYFLQGLDKATLSYASVFGLVSDAGLVGDQYS